MTHKFLFPVWLVIAALPGLGQDRLYPVTTTKGFPIVLTADRSSFVVEKAFQHKLTLAIRRTAGFARIRKPRSSYFG